MTVPMDWRSELRWLLDTYPGAAERIARAFDEGRVDPDEYNTECGTRGRLYGLATAGTIKRPDAIARDVLAIQVRTGWRRYVTRLEAKLLDESPTRHVAPKDDIYAEVIAYLAEHPTATEPRMVTR